MIPEISLQPSVGVRRRMLVERVIKGVLAAMAGVTVVTSVLIVVALVRPAISFFGDVNFLEFIGGVDWKPLFKPPHFGVWSIFVGGVNSFGGGDSAWPWCRVFP